MRAARGKHGARRALRAAAVVALALPMLAGCYEAPTTKTHSPGKYLGRADSAAVLNATDEQRAALRERFRLTQTDR